MLRGVICVGTIAFMRVSHVGETDGNTWLKKTYALFALHIQIIRIAVHVAL